MRKPPTPVTDEEIEINFLGTNFGNKVVDHRELLEVSVAKKLVGFHCGHTITVIMQRMRLIGKTGKPTARGMEVVRTAFADVFSRSG